MRSILPASATGERVFRGPCVTYVLGFLASAAWVGWSFEICGVTVLVAGRLVGINGSGAAKCH